MKVIVDLNVLLDVIQQRTPHYTDSATVLSRARGGEFEAFVPAHALTTLYYILEKAAGKTKADHTVDWMLQHFSISAVDKTTLLAARALGLADFEDAVVASLAVNEDCSHIVTRNEPDFADSPVPAVSPADFLAILKSPAS